MVPLLRPYSSHGVHLGIQEPSISKKSQNFNFFNCDVARYLIARDGSESLTKRNGRRTELGEHCSTCSKCLQTEEIQSAPSIPDYVEIRLSKDQHARLIKWVRRNHPECINNLGEAIRLSCEYHDYAYFTIMPEYRMYQLKYGELKKK